VRITLVTPTLNQSRFIERTLRSVLDQRGAFELEYLVQDGGSTDGTLDILRRQEDRLAWRSEPDAGQADALNRAFRRATGDVVGWLNSDDLLLPGALDRVARAFEQDPAAVWLHGGCEIVDEADRPIRRWIARYKAHRCRRYSRRSLLLENYVSQMTVFWRREALAAAGFLDPTLHLSFDYEYWLRLSRLGDPLYLPEPLAAFRWYPTSKSGANFVRQQLHEDQEVFLRHAPPGDRWLRLRKRLRSAQIVAVYGLLRMAGR
jgi:glycosyltransferase involved in cell wall biosynthesis